MLGLVRPLLGPTPGQAPWTGVEVCGAQAAADSGRWSRESAGVRQHLYYVCTCCALARAPSATGDLGMRPGGGIYLRRGPLWLMTASGCTAALGLAEWLSCLYFCLARRLSEILVDWPSGSGEPGPGRCKPCWNRGWQGLGGRSDEAPGGAGWIFT